jgi:hypothetical protein
MQPQSQAELERQLEQRTAQVQNGTLSFEQAFGTLDDWIIQLGKRKAFLHPNLKKWMWYDQLHNEWVFAGCGVGEAVLLTIGRTGGIKKLPQPGSVEDWCIYRKGQTLQGPLHIKELRQKLNAQQIPKDIFIWSAQSNDWLKLANIDESTFSLSNSANEIVLRLNDQGKFEIHHQFKSDREG